MEAVPNTIFRTKLNKPGQAVARFLGLLLLAAAAAKLMSGGVPSDSGGAMKAAVTGAIVCYEILLGLWLVSGVGVRWSLKMAALTFLVFAGATLWMVARGVKDCGCFGALSLPPRITYWLDVTALAAAVYAVLRQHRLGWVFPTAIFCLAGLAFAVGLKMVPLQTPAQAIEPGISWPPPQAVQLGEDLSKGCWVVLIYDSSCHRCESLAAGYAQDASEWDTSGKECKLALLDVNHAEHPETALPYGNIARGRLLQADWYESSPIVLFLDQGRILKVQDAWEIDHISLTSLIAAAFSTQTPAPTPTTGLK